MDSDLLHHASDVSAAFLGRPVPAMALTIAAYAAGVALQKRWPRLPVLNPTLIAIAFVATIIGTLKIPYQTYLASTQAINLMLGPAVVLLAVPVYRNRLLVRSSWRIVAVGLSVGMPAGVLGTIAIAWLCGAKETTLLSLVPRSVTTGIAIGIADRIGGIPALTAVFVILTGITGAIFGPPLLRALRVSDGRAVGLAIGIGAHGIGTARALQISDVAGAFSGIAMALNGIATALAVSLGFVMLAPEPAAPLKASAGSNPMGFQDVMAFLHARETTLVATFIALWIVALLILFGVGLFREHRRGRLRSERRDSAALWKRTA